MSGQPTRSYLIIASAIVIAGILISASLFIAVGGATKTTTTTITTTSIKTVTSTSTIVQSAFTCLKEVPQGAVMSAYSNSTSQGYSVTYSNGTEDFFPLNSCPVPVTPDNFAVDSAIETNPRFIAAENGSNYEAANGGSSLSLSIQSNNSTGRYGIFNFILYGSEKVYPCGGSYWTFNQLGLIQVTIPINSTGSLQFARMEVQTNGLPSTVILCTTTTG